MSWQGQSSLPTDHGSSIKVSLTLKTGDTWLNCLVKSHKEFPSDSKAQDGQQHNNVLLNKYPHIWECDDLIPIIITFYNPDHYCLRQIINSLRYPLPSPPQLHHSPPIPPPSLLFLLHLLLLLLFIFTILFIFLLIILLLHFNIIIVWGRWSLNWGMRQPSMWIKRRAR